MVPCVLWQIVTNISEEFAGEDGKNKVVTKLTFSKVMKAYGGLDL
jgi:hypothetical protein